MLQEWRALAALAAHGGQRLSDLSILTSIDLSTLSRLAGRMAQSGLLSRGRADGDKREIALALTAKGRRIVTAVIPVARRYERRALRGFRAAEEEVLKTLLVRVYANLAGDGR